MCACGQPAPTRRHWLWECPHFAPVPAPPIHEADAGLALRYVLKPQQAIDAWQLQPIQDLADAIRSSSHNLVIVATDGSGIGSNFLTRVASWGAAISNYSFASPVPTHDVTAYAGELYGALNAARAAHAAQKPIFLLIDNSSVANIVQEALHASFGSRRSFVATQLFRSFLLPGSRVCWVPSHDKHPDWQPPAPFTAKHFRSLNAAADVAASSVTSRLWKAEASFRREVLAAEQATIRSLDRLHRASAHTASLFAPSLVPPPAPSTLPPPTLRRPLPPSPPLPRNPPLVAQRV